MIFFYEHKSSRNKKNTIQFRNIRKTRANNYELSNRSGTELHLVAVYHPKTQMLDLKCSECRPVKWPEGDVPIASRVFMKRIETVGPLTFSIMASLSGIGIALAMCFLLFNISYRRMK